MIKEGTDIMARGKKITKDMKNRIQVLASKNLSNPEISRALGISENSVKRYRNGGDHKIVKKIVKSKKKAGNRGGATDPGNIETENGKGGAPAPAGNIDTVKGEKIEFIGGKKDMDKKTDSEAEDSFNICGSCGAEVKGTPEKCPSCGAEFDYSE